MGKLGENLILIEQLERGMAKLLYWLGWIISFLIDLVMLFQGAFTNFFHSPVVNVKYLFSQEKLGMSLNAKVFPDIIVKK